LDIIPNFKQISMIVTLIITYKWKRICGNQNSASKDNIDYFIIYIILYYIFVIFQFLVQQFKKFENVK